MSELGLGLATDCTRCGKRDGCDKSKNGFVLGSCSEYERNELLLFQCMWAIKNSPYQLLDMAFRNLYPGVRYNAYFETCIRDSEKGEKTYGLTCFEQGEITIFIDSNLSVADSIEIFAHELAHAAVGVDHDHDETWEAAFNALFAEYNRIGELLFETESTGENRED